jgi:hypothetical protein
VGNREQTGYAINHKQTTWHPTLADLLDKNLDLAMRALSLYSQNPTGLETVHKTEERR